MTQTGYYLPDRTWVEIPRTPIDRAGLVIPCWVERPDGSRVYVVERDEGDE